MTATYSVQIIETPIS
jgi:hypothetical protein